MDFSPFSRLFPQMYPSGTRTFPCVRRLDAWSVASVYHAVPPGIPFDRNPFAALGDASGRAPVRPVSVHALLIAFVIALSTPVLAALKEPDFGLFPALTLGLTFGIAFAYPAIIISEVLKHNAERKTDAAQADPAGFPDEPSGRTSPIRKPPPHTDAAPPGFRHPSCRSSLSPGRAHKPFPFFSHDALFPGATGKRHRAERLERCGNIFPHEPGRRENGVTEPKPAAFFPGRRETRAKEKVDAEPNPTPTHTKVFGGEPFWRKALPLHVSTIPPPSTRPPVRPPDAPAPQGRGRAPASRSCARAGGRRFAGPATPPAPGLRRRRDKGSP